MTANLRFRRDLAIYPFLKIVAEDIGNPDVGEAIYDLDQCHLVYTRLFHGHERVPGIVDLLEKKTGEELYLRGCSTMKMTKEVVPEDTQPPARQPRIKTQMFRPTAVVLGPRQDHTLVFDTEDSGERLYVETVDPKRHFRVTEFARKHPSLDKLSIILAKVWGS